MNQIKNFSQILMERQQNQKQKETETKELTTVSDKNKNLVTSFKTQVLSKDLNEIPALNIDLVLHNDSITKETKEKLSLIKDELIHGYHVVSRRRTDCEKRISVLQENRFTTHGAKFFQANLEQQVHTQNLVNLTLEIEETNIELEKLLFEYKQLENKINKIKSKQENNFTETNDAFVIDKNTDEIFLLEKELQLLSIKIRRKLVQLKEQKMNAENESQELLEWSQIKTEEFALAKVSGEAFDSEDQNFGQFIHLAKRFFMNYIVAHSGNSDATTSDIINIDGLCLTALKLGREQNLLGKMFEGFSKEQIAFIWKGIYNSEIEFYTDEQGLEHFRAK